MVDFVNTALRLFRDTKSIAQGRANLLMQPVGNELTLTDARFLDDWRYNRNDHVVQRDSYSFENVFASLRPFYIPTASITSTGSNSMAPIIDTNGLIFPYNPTISEGVSVRYDSIPLTHSNESYHTYQGTDNVRITLSDAKWTADTFDNALYMLSVIHFFRSYSLMDFGRGRTGRPPSPMWFSAYGNYAYQQVPCLLEKADWTFPNDMDYVGIPEPGSDEYESRTLVRQRNGKSKYTWLPVELTVSSINLIVQHTPSYWSNFSLEDYYSGEMLRRDRGSFHDNGSVTSSGTTVDRLQGTFLGD